MRQVDVRDVLRVNAGIQPDGARALNREGGADEEHNRQRDLDDEKDGPQARAPRRGSIFFQRGHKHGS